MHIKRYSLWHFHEQWNYRIATIKREATKRNLLALYLIARLLAVTVMNRHLLLLAIESKTYAHQALFTMAF